MAKSIDSLRKFVAPEFIFGVGARFQAARYAHHYGASRVLVVTDPGITKAGWVSELEDLLNSEGIEYTVFEKVSSNPRDFEVMKGLEVFDNNDCDSIIAIGGGSPMDLAKGISIVAGNGGNILDYEGVDTVPEPGPPLICIPTTAGTAADVSQFAIINDTENKNKIAIITKAIVPDVALIDPETTVTMNPYLTACTGMDAMTHAVEAIASNAHSAITDIHAYKAIELVNENLLKAVQEPENMKARENMTLASLEAGLAFSNASLGAVHAMAHSLGGFLDLPHGECNALLLEHVVAFNIEKTKQQYQQVSNALNLDTKKMNLDELKKTLTGHINGLRKSVKITNTLGDSGVKKENIKELAEKAYNDPCLLTNPRKANKRDIEAIYEEAL